MADSDPTLLRITQWEKPSEGWLKITVREPILDMTESYYWCEQRAYEGAPLEWGWRMWSMAGKPTVKVSPGHARILSGLVRDHPVLCHVGVDLGIAASDFGLDVPDR